jgi:hypothetical protein
MSSLQNIYGKGIDIPNITRLHAAREALERIEAWTVIDSIGHQVTPVEITADITIVVYNLLQVGHKLNAF